MNRNKYTKASPSSRNGGTTIMEDIEAVKQKERAGSTRKSSAPGAYSMQPDSENKSGARTIMEDIEAVKRRERSTSTQQSRFPGAYSMQPNSENKSGARTIMEDIEAVKQRERSASTRKSSAPGAYSMQPNLGNRVGASPSVSGVSRKAGTRLSIEEMEAAKARVRGDNREMEAARARAKKDYSISREMEEIKARAMGDYSKEKSAPGAFSVRSVAEDKPNGFSSEAVRKPSAQSLVGRKSSREEMEDMNKRERESFAYGRKDSSHSTTSGGKTYLEKMEAVKERKISSFAYGRNDSNQSTTKGVLSLEEMEAIKQRESSMYAFGRKDSSQSATSRGGTSLEEMEAIKQRETSNYSYGRKNSGQSAATGGVLSLGEMEAIKVMERERSDQNGKTSIPSRIHLTSSSNQPSNDSKNRVSNLPISAQPGAIRVEFTNLKDSNEESGVRGDLQALERDAFAKVAKHDREEMSANTDLGMMVVRPDLQSLEAKVNKYSIDAVTENYASTDISQQNASNTSRRIESSSNNDCEERENQDEENNGNEDTTALEKSLNEKKRKCCRIVGFIVLAFSIISTVLIIVLLPKGTSKSLDEQTSTVQEVAEESNEDILVNTEMPSLAPTFQKIIWQNYITLGNENLKSMNTSLGFLDEFLIWCNGNTVQVYDISDENELVRIGGSLRGESVQVSDSNRIAVKIQNVVRVYALSDNNQWVQIGKEITGFHSEQNISLSGDGKTVAISALLNEGKRSVTRIYNFHKGGWREYGDDIVINEQIEKVGISLSHDASKLVLGKKSFGASRAGASQAYNRPAGSTWWDEITTSEGGYTGGPDVDISADGKIIVAGGTGIIGAYTIDGIKMGELKIYDKEQKTDAVLTLSSDGKYIAFAWRRNLRIATISNDKWHSHNIKGEKICTESIISLAFSNNDKIAIGCGRKVIVKSKFLK